MRKKPVYRFEEDVKTIRAARAKFIHDQAAGPGLVAAHKKGRLQAVAGQ